MLVDPKEKDNYAGLLPVQLVTELLEVLVVVCLHHDFQKEPVDPLLSLAVGIYWCNDEDKRMLSGEMEVKLANGGFSYVSSASEVSFLFSQALLEQG